MAPAILHEAHVGVDLDNQQLVDGPVIDELRRLRQRSTEPANARSARGTVRRPMGLSALFRDSRREESGRGQTWPRPRRVAHRACGAVDWSWFAMWHVPQVKLSMPLLPVDY